MKLLNLKYKGSRTYVHGSDIFNTITDTFSLNQTGHISKLMFKKISRNQIEILMKKPSNEALLFGNGVWKAENNESSPFWLQETTSPIKKSYPYDEDIIIATARIIDTIIENKATNDYSAIENIIALTKKLNYHLLPDVRGKWLFGQIDLQRGFPNNWDNITICQISCIGTSFSRNRILIDRKNYGEIRFIGGQP